MRKKETAIRIPEIEEPSWIPLIIVSLLQLWPISAILLFRNLHRLWKNARLKRYRRYALIIGDRPYVRLWELARATGCTKAEVRADLQEMIDKGYMGARAYVDQSTDCVVIDPERRPDGTGARVETVFADERREEPPRAQAAPREAPAPQPQPAPRPQPAPAKPAPAAPQEDEFEKILRQIRELNDRIADGPMSRQIDRIGEITASIFMVVKLKPERREEVQKFMGYYLPTTMKLLESYSLLEKQSYQGENIVAARQDIEKIIDTMVPAFEKQLDRLFKTEALDISTDIDVLETMMAKDGLTEKEGTTLRMGGT